MDLRITTQVRVGRALDNLRRQADELANLQQQAQTGLRVNKPSDDPLNVSPTIENKAKDVRLDAYSSNIKTATSTLDSSVSTLTDLSNVFTRARQIALEGANSTTTTPGFEALASEVDRLIDRAFSLSNTTVEGRTLFGGTATDRPAFAITSVDPQGKPLTIDYQGAADSASTLIGPSETVDTNYAGTQIFEIPGSEAFKALLELRNNLRLAANNNLNPAVLSQNVADIENAQDAILTTVGQMSANLENLGALETRLEDVQLQVKTRIGELESADLAKVVLDLRTQENLYSTTLATSARIFDQNLLDFLR